MIDWSKPIEAVHEDGRVVPVKLQEYGFAGGPNPDRGGDYWIEGEGFTGCKCWREGYPYGDGWSVRNKITFPLGARVTKTKGSSWTGKVVGYYSTSLTPEGVCVESENEPGSVQIYPVAALRLVD